MRENTTKLGFRLCGIAAIAAMVATSGPVCLAGEADEPAAPASADLRPRFLDWGLGPRTQAGRDTCSVFVVTAAIEYAAAAKQDRPVRLSVEFLNWASNHTVGQSADGGFFSDLWLGYLASGVCPEEALPYQERFDADLQPGPTVLCRAKRFQSLALQLHWIKEWDPHRGLTDEQLAEVRRTLKRGWPVCGGFLWPKREQWDEGLLAMCPRRAVRDGHSVLLVGYRDDPALPGGGAFLIWNSSGPNRDGLLSYEYVRAYMNDAAWIDDGRGATARSPRRS